MFLTLWLSVLPLAAGTKLLLSPPRRPPHGMQRAYQGPAMSLQVVLSADLSSCLIFLGRFLSTELGPMVVAEQTDDQPFSMDWFSAQTWVLPTAHIRVWLAGRSLLCRVCSNWGNPLAFSPLQQWLVSHVSELTLMFCPTPVGVMVMKEHITWDSWFIINFN